jgi:hypothetical protein
MEVVQRGLAAKFFAVEEESSPPQSSRRSSSGCQSGWTLYLDYHSDGVHHLEPSGHNQRCRMLPREDDSMLSDASSGPPRRDDLQFFLGRHHQRYSGTGGVVHHGANASDSGSASTSISQGRRRHHQRYSGTGGVVHHGASASDSGSASTSISQGRRRHHAMPAAVEDDLDDTASSSRVRRCST